MKWLVIRQAQMEALAQPMFERFVRTAVDHVRQHFGAVADALGESELDRGVRHVLGRAARHGVDSERDLLRYVRLAFVFGRDFDVDPALPWAGRILAGAEPASRRVARLVTVGLREESSARGYAAGA